MFTFYCSVNYTLRVFCCWAACLTNRMSVRVCVCCVCLCQSLYRCLCSARTHTYKREKIVRFGFSGNRPQSITHWAIELQTHAHMHAHIHAVCMHERPSHTVRLTMHITRIQAQEPFLHTYMGVIRFHDIITNDQYKFCTACQIVAFCLRHSHVKVVYFVAIDTYIFGVFASFLWFFFLLLK